jgi:hypothetical protein
MLSSAIRISLVTRGFGVGKMEQYEIRIQSLSAKRVVSSFQASDHAAIRRGRSLVKEGEGLEVWRAEACVYARPGREMSGADP